MPTDEPPDALTNRQAEVLQAIRDRSDEYVSSGTLADEFGLAEDTIYDHIDAVRQKGYPLSFDRARNGWYLDPDFDDGANADADASPELDTDDADADADADSDGDADDTSDDEEGDDTALPDLSETPIATDAEPSSQNLTGRERVIVDELRTGATVDELRERVDDRESVILQHLKDLRRDGWNVYVDDTAGHIALENDGTLRSSEHTGTRTRKANQWWARTHDAVVRQFKRLETPTVNPTATPDREDWVVHMTDLHAGDVVRGYDGKVIHDTDRLLPLIDYITARSVALADKHGSEYDECVIGWGGDFVTNSGIYEGQFEDLDLWLDDQIATLHDPLLRQIKAHSRAFDSVHVVCQAGNHGEIRASGSSKQANADLILYKGVRNTVAALQEVGHLENVRFTIGRAEGPTPFYLRDGAIHGQLRHGQNRSPQADTSARKKEWLSTILDSESFGSSFDVAWMGHHHVSGRLPWNGPPVIITGTPKPGGEYPRALGELVGPNQPTVATCHGVSNEGITGVFPVDTRNYDGSEPELDTDA
jgi:biotin operon repressor